MQISIIIFITIFFGFAITPFIITLAKKHGFIDKPNERKVHTEAIPRIGGVSIYLSFNLGLFLIYYFTDYMKENTGLFVSLLVGGTLIALLGIVDDKSELSAMSKLCGQIVVAALVMLMGHEITSIANPFSGGTILLGWFAIPVTILWIIAITNCINLIDGLDGLAGGVSVIGALSISIIAGIAGRESEGAVAIILAASIIGFLIFNFHPAKIFMGDIGSLFLGFVFAILTLENLETLTFFGIMVPVLVLAIPILDTLYAIIRRKFNKMSIFKADKLHLHHRLLSKGMSQRKAVLTIYLVSISFCVLGIIVPYVSIWLSLGLFIVLMCLFQYTYSTRRNDKKNKSPQ